MQLTNSDGTDLLPKSAKTCGLLALLATSPNMSRPRRWLEDKLWSDRGPEQAGASLRQSLSQLRRQFKTHPNLLYVDRKTIRLNDKILRTDIKNARQAILEGKDFLEGLRIRDPQFNEWLNDIRSFYQNPAYTHASGPSIAHPRRLGIRSHFTGTGSDAAVFTAEMSAMHLAKSICEQTDAHYFTHIGNPPTEDVDIEVYCDVVERAQMQTLLIRVNLVKTGLVLHSKIVDLGTGTIDYPNNDHLLRVIFDTSEQVLRKLPRFLNEALSGQYAASLMQQAIEGVFSFNESTIAHADQQFEIAFDQMPIPAILAWRALIRNIRFIEQPEFNSVRLKQEATQFIADAIAMDGDNSFVMSIAALIQVMMHQDALGAMDIARPAVEANPNSAFALQSISMAHMISGNTESAYLISKRSHHITNISRFGYWWDMCHSLACISSNRFSEALQLAEAASRRAPNFRPPLRALIALHGYNGTTHDAAIAASRLARIEDNFSMRAFFVDKNYPIKTIRTAGLLQMPKESMMVLRG